MGEAKGSKQTNSAEPREKSNDNERAATHWRVRTAELPLSGQPLCCGLVTLGKKINKIGRVNGRGRPSDVLSLILLRALAAMSHVSKLEYIRVTDESAPQRRRRSSTWTCVSYGSDIGNIILERTEFALCKFTFASSISAPPRLLTSLTFYLSREREPLRLLVTAI